MIDINTAANAYIEVTVNWFDEIGRLVNSADYGRDDGTTRYVYNASGNLIDTDADGIPDEAENSARLPNTSDEYIAVKLEYDTYGRQHKTTDNKAVIAQRTYDTYGRLSKSIENYINGTVTETETDTDRTTEIAYDTLGRQSALKAHNPKGSGNGVETQETMYLYKSELASNLVTNIIYPDSSDTDETGTDQVKHEYDRLGRKTKTTDQRGTVHEYDFDSAGRLAADKVTTVGTGVDTVPCSKFHSNKFSISAC